MFQNGDVVRVIDNLRDLIPTTVVVSGMLKYAGMEGVVFGVWESGGYQYFKLMIDSEDTTYNWPEESVEPIRVFLGEAENDAAVVDIEVFDRLF